MNRSSPSAARVQLVKRRLRRRLKPHWMRFLRFSGLIWWGKRQLLRQGSVIVLTLHRVLPDGEFENTNSPPGMVMRARTFEVMAAHVARNYRPVSLDDAIAWQRGPADGLRIAFTFDDGWSDTADVAFPIAQRHGVPIAVFVCPLLTGRQSPFWPERVIASLRAGGRVPDNVSQTIESLKALPPAERERRLAGFTSPGAPEDSTMSWEDIRRLDAAGVLFGSHTQSHQLLAQIPFDAALRELAESRAAIEQALGKPCTLLAYPNGSHAPEVREAAARAGYRAAFAVMPGAWTKDTDPLAIPRMNIWEGEVADSRGRFVRTAFEYSVIWRAYRNSRRRR